MIYARVLLAAFVVLAVIYYVMVIGQLFGKWKITNREIKFSYLCIPFYYWMVSQEEKKQGENPWYYYCCCCSSYDCNGRGLVL